MSGKLTLEDLPRELQSQYLLTKEEMEDRGTTVYDLMFLIGRRGVQMGRPFHISYCKVSEDILFSWSPVASSNVIA